jgi:hypothetical protein
MTTKRVDEKGPLGHAEDLVANGAVAAAKGIHKLAKKGVEAIKNSGGKTSAGNKLRRDWQKKVNSDWTEYASTHGIKEPTEGQITAFANLYYHVQLSPDDFEKPAPASSPQAAAPAAAAAPQSSPAAPQASTPASTAPAASAPSASGGRWSDQFSVGRDGTARPNPATAAKRAADGWPGYDRPAANSNAAPAASSAAPAPAAVPPATPVAPAISAPTPTATPAAAPAAATPAPSAAAPATPAARRPRTPKAKPKPLQPTLWATQGNSPTQAMNPTFANFQNKSFSDIMAAVNSGAATDSAKPTYDKGTILPLVKELVGFAVDHGGTEKNRAIAFLQKLKQNPSLMKSMPELQKIMQPLMAARDQQPTDYDLNGELQKAGLRPTRKESFERVIDYAVYLIENGVSNKRKINESFRLFFEATNDPVSKEGFDKIVSSIVMKLLHDPQILDASRKLSPMDPKMSQYLRYRQTGSFPGQRYGQSGPQSVQPNTGGAKPQATSTNRNSSFAKHMRQAGVDPQSATEIFKAAQQARSFEEFETMMTTLASGKEGYQKMAATLWSYINASKNA